MSTHNITVESGKSVRLLTAGKYCDRDIIVTATGGASTETCTISLHVDAYGDIVVDYVYKGSNKTVTAPAGTSWDNRAITTIEADCGTEITLTHTGGESLNFGGGTSYTWECLVDNGDVATYRVPSESGDYHMYFDHS